MRNYLLLFLMAFTGISYSQTVTLRGTVQDPDGTPLEAATVYLSTAKDSTLIDYTITNKSGKWEIKTRPSKTAVLLKVSFVGLAGYRKVLETVNADMDLGTIALEDKGTELGEVVIQGEVPPIRIKKDTLEFDAASFAVRPDANVQELLKQLPGVEIDAEGKITVNGKEVSQILVNGKPFFDKDGKIALQNLPAEIINKIQVTSKKTKEEELTGQNAKGNEASINITIDEEKNKGFMMRIIGGFGSSGRYDHSGLVNYFKGERKISVLASTNNINATGFSMDEIFDNMSGGRNTSIWSDGESYNINGMQFGGGKGITKSDIIGINYADKWAKSFDGALNYFYTAANSDNLNRTRETNFVPTRIDPATGNTIDDSYVRTSESKNNQERYAHNFNTQFTVKIDSTATLYFEPKFVKGHNRSDNNITQNSARLSDGRALNDNRGTYTNQTDNNGFSNYLTLSKSLKGKKGRVMSFTVQNENNTSDGYNLNNTVTNSYDYTTGNPVITAEARNQLRKNRQTSDNYTASLQYNEPVSDSAQVNFAFAFGHKGGVENRQGYDFDSSTNRYSTANAALSGYLESETERFRPVLGYTVTKNKFWFNIQAGPRFINFSNHGAYQADRYTVNRNYSLPSGDVQMNYQMSKTKSLWTSYSYDVELPSAAQILPVQDVLNPLSTTTGFAGLRPRKYHNFNINLYDYDYPTRTGYSYYAGGEYNEQAIVGYNIINEDATSFNSYRNANDTYYVWFGANWGKSFKKEAHDFKVNLGLHGEYKVDKGFMNEQLYKSKQVDVGPRVNFTYKYGELLTINPNYSFSYVQTNYSNYTLSETSYFTHRVGFSTTSYWPKHFVFGNDINYTYNSQLSSSFKRDFYLWNTSLGYNFWKDQLLFKVKVYDVLNQNLGTSRSINATTISDQENIVLKRYVMFSLSLKLNKFGAKKEEAAAGSGIITF
ncbi:TonB-dependent receptor [Flavobacterium psychrotrophum]|uniref:TonB-dependent receptor n=1 Tax=Flavobacterium psychrotrophum TaxID=2294119 RepID=UPI000E32076B|nr:TonB-dependent receptor [Flavobacterium psychrotrophum]